MQEFVASIEQAVVGPVRCCPDFVHVLEPSGAYVRALVDGLCQYYDLRAHNEAVDDGLWQTTVECSSAPQAFPALSLAEYLAAK